MSQRIQSVEGRKWTTRRRSLARYQKSVEIMTLWRANTRGTRYWVKTYESSFDALSALAKRRLRLTERICELFLPCPHDGVFVNTSQHDFNCKLQSATRETYDICAKYPESRFILECMKTQVSECMEADICCAEETAASGLVPARRPVFRSLLASHSRRECTSILCSLLHPRRLSLIFNL